MLRDCWGVIFQHFQIAPRPAELTELADGRWLAVGDYVGTERGTGWAVRASFAHVLRLFDGRVVELRQITDTAMWAPRPLSRAHRPRHPAACLRL